MQNMLVLSCLTYLDPSHQSFKRYSCMTCFFEVVFHVNAFIGWMLDPHWYQEKQNLAEIIQMFHQTKARQLSMQSDANSLTAYPEYILAYLVHALAHHSCPNIDECKDVKAFEVLYRYLYLLLEHNFTYDMVCMWWMSKFYYRGTRRETRKWKGIFLKFFLNEFSWSKRDGEVLLHDYHI